MTWVELSRPFHLIIVISRWHVTDMENNRLEIDLVRDLHLCNKEDKHVKLKKLPLKAYCFV